MHIHTYTRTNIHTHTYINIYILYIHGNSSNEQYCSESPHTTDEYRLYRNDKKPECIHRDHNTHRMHCILCNAQYAVRYTALITVLIPFTYA